LSYQQQGPQPGQPYPGGRPYPGLPPSPGGGPTARLRPAAWQPGLRATDRDREAAVEVLREAFATGRLSDEEHSGRLSRALAAQTYAELDALTADLPDRPSYPDAPPGAQPPRGTNGFAVASLACGLAQPVTGMLTTIPAIVFGHIARHQIRETGENGKGMATWGLVLGWGGVTAAVALILLIIAAAASLLGNG
jgi:hypothetical protein